VWAEAAVNRLSPPLFSFDYSFCISVPAIPSGSKIVPSTETTVVILHLELVGLGQSVAPRAPASFLVVTPSIHFFSLHFLQGWPPMYLILQDSLEFFVALLKLDDIFLKALAS
jgi:hypothetical protein